MLVIPREPLEYLDPELRLVVAPIRRDGKCHQETSQSLTLSRAREEETRLRQNGRAHDERLLRKPIEVPQCRSVESIARIAQRDDRRRVE